jgi:hypothetical protein
MSRCQDVKSLRHQDVKTLCFFVYVEIEKGKEDNVVSRTSAIEV